MAGVRPGVRPWRLSQGEQAILEERLSPLARWHPPSPGSLKWLLGSSLAGHLLANVEGSRAPPGQLTTQPLSHMTVLGDSDRFPHLTTVGSTSPANKTLSAAMACDASIPRTERSRMSHTIRSRGRRRREQASHQWVHGEEAPLQLRPVACLAQSQPDAPNILLLLFHPNTSQPVAPNMLVPFP